MADLCRHEPLCGLLSTGGLSTGWAWCRDCGAIFRRSELLPPVVWDQDKPFSRVWMSDVDESMWWTRPKRAGAEPGWSCEHAGSLPLTGRHAEGLWRWCEDCGAVWQSPMTPIAPWHHGPFEREHRVGERVEGVWHHPAFHGDSPAEVRSVLQAFDGGGTYLYGAPDG